MITIIQSKGYAFAWRIIGDSWYVPSDPVNDYATGESKPNYPMPAIPLAVLITNDYVSIAEPDYFEGELMEFIIVADFEKD